MMLGSVILAMAFGVAASGFLYMQDAALWKILVTYPLSGIVTLFLAMAAAWRRATAGSVRTATLADGHRPVPRTTTPTVATSTLRSVARDRFRA
jgi:hypothetical protein